MKVIIVTTFKKNLSKSSNYYDNLTYYVKNKI